MMSKMGLKFLRFKPMTAIRRWQNTDAYCGEGNTKKGLVLGVYEGCKAGEYKFTPTGSKFDEEVGGKVSELVKGTDMSVGKTRVFHNLGSEFYAVALAGLGQEGLSYNENETLDECKENIRIAAGLGSMALNKNGVAKIFVEGFTNTEAAAEGSTLAVWKYQELKHSENRSQESTVDLYDDPDVESWARGKIKSESQNIARKLEETPANIMTPMKFAQSAIEILCPCGVQVDIRDRDWIMEKGMTAFLAMARSSCDPPLFLEISYCGGSEEDKPVVLVGKGVTFDSGGLCLHPCRLMNEYKADMAGAAVIVGTMKALALLGLPINVTGLIPLMENMPGGMAMKPGDVVAGLGKKTMRIENPSHDGRIILSDALAFSTIYKPCLVISIATSTQGIREALGSSASGSFTTSEVVWKEMRKAGAVTGDRVWRMPAWKVFTDKVTNFESVDVDNVGKFYGSPSKNAAFLLEFAPPVDYMHMDIFGTGMRSYGIPAYLKEGHMTGRPTRTVVQFLNQMACPMDKVTEC
ncbi:cytosol aminopeptidase-like [Cimex lectularius]|uniref:Cytosol aminopeptidase n=1 Tax=Cimex lectularius TaxID=79782 RepID=A0A8I6S6N3_CIMLE|nr:cytosol aminopeptidase-like [Cimex lectularius]